MSPAPVPEPVPEQSVPEEPAQKSVENMQSPVQQHSATSSARKRTRFDFDKEQDELENEFARKRQKRY